MSFKEFFPSFMKSPLGVGSILGATALGLIAVLAGTSVPMAVFETAGAWCVFFVVSFVSGAAPKAAVAARERGRGIEAAERIADLERRRDSLAALRLSDTAVRDALQYVVVEAGELIDACRRAGSWDPSGALALEEAAEIVNLHLRELDDVSKERRFGAADSDPFADARARTVEALKAKALALKNARTALDGGLTRDERMKIDEELR